MLSGAPHRAFKDRLYGQFARVGKALASPHRLELLELLAQGERTVDSLANEAGMSIASASQHLQTLREGGLFELSKSLRIVAERRLAELERVVREHFGARSDPEPVSMEELVERVRSGKVVVVDTRPAGEYAAGHIAGAISIPIDDLEERLRKLPKTKEYVAYCRGPYCAYADRAVELLSANGRRARRLAQGFPEWKASGLPIETGGSAGV
jgi:rhodanese-related sulfurtransferase